MRNVINNQQKYSKQAQQVPEAANKIRLQITCHIWDV